MSKTGPNIILFLTDDHARWALPSYGNGAVHAPNLSALAARGIVYEDAYTASPVCSPARASLLTGLMPSEHGVHDFLASNPKFDGHNWLEGIPTLATALRAAGYRCGLVGKWHLAMDSTPPAGFESWYALNGEYPIQHEGDNGFSRNGVQERVVGNLTDAITAGALDFLEEADDRPYFLIVGYYATHSPWSDQPSRLVDLYATHDFVEIDQKGPIAPGLLNVELAGADEAGRRAARQNYYAAVSHIDEGVGQVLAAVDGSRTLAIYTADHGLSLGQHGIFGKGNATRPQNLLDDNIRIPLIVAGPGVATGERVSGFFDHTDTHQMILAAAGLGHRALPENKALQFCEYGTARMVRTKSHKLVTWTNGSPSQLYQVGEVGELRLDPAADPSLQPLVRALEQAVSAFFDHHSDPSRSGPEALRQGRYNNNQAWDSFVPRA